jgi:uncharacterized protein (TIRG00374 family)
MGDPEGLSAVSDTQNTTMSWFRRWGVGILISMLALLAAFWGFHPQRLLKVLVQGNYVYLVPVATLLILGLLLRARSWKVLLFDEVPFRRAFTALNQGYLANNALPLRIGEFVRAYVVSFDQSLGVLKTLPSVIVERVIDIFLSLSFLLISFLTLALPAWSRNVAQAAGFFFIIGIIVLGVLAWRGDRLTEFIRRVPIPGLPGLARMSDEFINALQRIVRSRSTLARTCVLLFGTWVTAWAQFFFVAEVYGVHLNLAQLMFATSITAFGAAIPASPGAIGVFELAAVSGLMVLGISKEIGLSMAILWHGMSLVFTSVIGAYTLAQDSRSIGELGANAQEFYATLRKA